MCADMCLVHIRIYLSCTVTRGLFIVKRISVNETQLIHHFVFQLTNQNYNEGGNCTAEVEKYCMET